MTYGEMFERCTDTIRNEKIADYRPNEKMHTEDLEDRCGIRLWFNNGDSAIYYPSVEALKAQSDKDNNVRSKTDGDCITDEQAIKHLQSTGWMQNHDKQMYEMGLRKQLADDSGSYDALIPSEDTISRRAAIDTLEKIPVREFKKTDGLLDALVSVGQVYMALKQLPSAQPKINNQINLCDTCRHTYPDCPAGKDDILFGNGAWNDNICACGKYEVFEQDWIPCSKDMPRQYGNYLVSIEGEEPDIGTINPFDGRGWSLCDANGFYWAYDRMLNITAWKPLPEPYRGDTECKNGNTK